LLPLLVDMLLVPVKLAVLASEVRELSSGFVGIRELTGAAFRELASDRKC
jgi:hypothetical protein